MKALGVHIYAGGFTEGVKRHFDVVAVFEDQGYGSSSHRKNHPEVPVYVGKANWPDTWNDDIEFLYANPPCAVFSSAGIATTRGRDGWRTDVRLGCWYDCYNLFESVRPRAFALESVTQAYTTGREVIDEFTKRALLGGYSVTHLLVDAKWFGVPQSRRRFFFIAHKPPRLQYATPNWAPPPTIGEVLAEVSDPGPSAPVAASGRSDYVRALEATLPGHRICEVWMTQNPGYEERRATNARGHVTGRPSFADRRLALDEVMGAFIGDKSFHPTENRRLGFNEMKAVCGYPDNFVCDGPIGGWGSLLARAVLPPVADWLARVIAATLGSDDAPWSDRRVTLVDLREPGREPVDLTGQYLEGEHRRVRVRLRADGTVDYRSTGTPVGASNPVPPSRVPTTSKPPLPAPEIAVSEPKITVGSDDPKPEPGEGSGKFIQRLWLAGFRDPDHLVALVHANYAGRTTTKSDVYYNYRKLLDAGQVGATWPSSKKKQVVEHKSTVTEERAATTKSIIHHERAVRLESTGSRERAAPVESTGREERVVAKESTECRERAERTEGTVAIERAECPESTGNAERAEFSESTDVDERAGCNESTEHAERLPAPAVLNGGGKRALMTGSTPIQVGSERTQLKIMSNQDCWRDALVDLGYEVDRRVVRPGENLSSYDVVLACLNKPNAIVSKQVYGALWALYSRPDAIATLDDWQTHELVSGIQTCSRDFTRAFRINGVEVADREKQTLFDFLGRLASEPWPFPVVAPIFEGGKPSLLGLPAKVVGIDPSAYAKRYAPTPVEVRDRRWVQASLLVKKTPTTSWPIDCYGNPGRGEGGIGKTDLREAQPRVTEAELMAIYCQNWGVLSPAHDHSGAGWFRIRYQMAADAGCVLSADRAEAEVLGEPYVWAAEPTKVEELNDDELEDVASEQQRLLARIAWPKERVVDALRSLIEERVR